MSMLERGGNAFDAAVAGGFTLQVVEPHLNGPAGEVPILVHDVRKGKTEVICGQGVAPGAATPERFAELGLDLVPGTGLLATVVPGSFDAWMLMLRDYGSMTVREVLEPVIHYARKGVPVLPRISSAVASMRTVYENHWPGSRDIYLKNRDVPKVGAMHTNPTLADTYERILAEAEAAGGDREKQIEAARRAWYKGFVAEHIDRFSQSGTVLDAEGNPHKGLLNGDDMARWQATVEAPVSTTFRDYEVFKPGFWSQGPVMLQQLALLEGYNLEELDASGDEYVHLMLEAAKLAFADREAAYGDPAFVDVPMETLLSKDYAAARRKLISDTSSLQLQPGVATTPAWQAHLDALNRREATSAVGAGEPTVAPVLGIGEPTVALPPAERGDTCHLCVVDRHGNMVSATPSGGWLQSSPIIPELGFPLNSRAQMFWLQPDLPSTIAPYKRPRTTLSASIAHRDGKPYMAWGTPGGDQQDQWSLQLFLRHTVSGLNLQEAAEAPNWHSDHFPSSFWPRASKPNTVVVDPHMPAETVEKLRKRGHDVTLGPAWSEGRLCAVSRTDDVLKGGADPRSTQCYSIGR
jgi:gamma-glutamyltranspeptidase/glutathione hydrolase